MTDNARTLSEYLIKLCEARNLSMRQASELAKLAPTTINQIVRRDKTSTPRPETLRMIADALGGSYDYMMMLAGHMPPHSRPSELGPEVRYRLQEITRLLVYLDPPEREHFIESALRQLQFVLDVKGVGPGAEEAGVPRSVTARLIESEEEEEPPELTGVDPEDLEKLRRATEQLASLPAELREYVTRRMIEEVEATQAQEAPEEEKENRLRG